MSTSSYVQHYQRVITDRLLLPTRVDGDGDLCIEVADTSIFLEAGEGDWSYLRLTGLVRPPDLPPAELCRILNQVNHRCKAAKAVQLGEGVAVHVEVVNAASGTIADPDHITATLPRQIRLLLHAVNEFFTLTDEAITLQQYEADLATTD